jgi:hypothetical protein
VLISRNLEAPPFNGKKGDDFIMWRDKFKADQVMKGVYTKQSNLFRKRAL